MLQKSYHLGPGDLTQLQWLAKTLPSNKCFNIWRFILLTACNRRRLEGIMLVRQKGIPWRVSANLKKGWVVYWNWIITWGLFSLSFFREVNPHDWYRKLPFPNPAVRGPKKLRSYLSLEEKPPQMCCEFFRVGEYFGFQTVEICFPNIPWNSAFSLRPSANFSLLSTL